MTLWWQELKIYQPLLLISSHWTRLRSKHLSYLRPDLGYTLVKGPGSSVCLASDPCSACLEQTLLSLGLLLRFQNGNDDRTYLIWLIRRQLQWSVGKCYSFAYWVTVIMVASSSFSWSFTSLPPPFSNTKPLIPIGQVVFPVLPNTTVVSGFLSLYFCTLLGFLNSLSWRFFPFPATFLSSTRSCVLVHLWALHRLPFCLHVSPSPLPTLTSLCLANSYSSNRAPLQEALPESPLCPFWLSILLTPNHIHYTEFQSLAYKYVVSVLQLDRCLELQ